MLDLPANGADTSVLIVSPGLLNTSTAATKFVKRLAVENLNSAGGEPEKLHENHTWSTINIPITTVALQVELEFDSDDSFY